MSKPQDDPARVPEEAFDFDTPSAASRAPIQKTAELVPPQQALAKVDEKLKVEVPLDKNGALAPVNMDQALRIARWAIESRIVPAKTQAEAFVIMQRGAELGFKGLAAFEFLYAVNNRARISPNGIKAKALSSGLVEDFEESVTGEGDARTATVSVKRRGIPTPIKATFSIGDAKRAKLSSKDNWQGYPDRMLLARSRGYAWGDAFPDMTGGMPVREMFDRDEDEDARMAPPQEKDALLAEVVGEE
jgi:hypothetical protein